MKKKSIRLTLSKETLRSLDRTDLETVAGGAIATQVGTCWCTGTNCRISLCICV